MENLTDFIKSHKIIAIVRGVAPEKVMPVLKAIYDGGIKLMEITFDQTEKIPFKDTAKAIEEACSYFAGKAHIGAGTVITPEQVDIACKAGAEYIISPGLVPQVVSRTLECGRVAIPGAFSPSEIILAHNLGAQFVKVFPADTLGVPYIKSVLKPLSHIDCIATGGVDLSNARQFLDAGCAGLGIGGVLADNRLIENGEFYKITEKSRAFSEIVGDKI